MGGRGAKMGGGDASAISKSPYGWERKNSVSMSFSHRYGGRKITGDAYKAPLTNGKYATIIKAKETGEGDTHKGKYFVKVAGYDVWQSGTLFKQPFNNMKDALAGIDSFLRTHHRLRMKNR